MQENQNRVHDGPPFLVRPALESDLAVIATLHAASFGAAWPLSFWREHLEQPSSQLLVADCGSLRCAAALLAHRVIDEAEIITIVTEQRSRRHGLASALLAHLERALASDQPRSLPHSLPHGLPCRIFLEVSIENRAALNLYRQRGYVERGRRSGYYPSSSGGAAVDALILSLDI